jgi:hypothetical protein
MSRKWFHIILLGHYPKNKDMINLKKYKSIKGKNAQKQGLELNMHSF